MNPTPRRTGPFDPMQHSRALTRKSASNLALAFILLPRRRRDAMAALYAFCRAVDDVADEDALPVAERRQQLAAWRADLRRACDGARPEMILNQEFQPVIQEFHLPFALLNELITGCETDLDITRYPDWPELEQYCYRVASVVGLLSLDIFGCRNPVGRDYAIHLGHALQLTNILRDVKTDAARGRIYLPLSELARHGVTEQEILDGRYSERYLALARTVAARARGHYQKARQLLPDEDRRALVAAELMGSVYWQLLLKLEAGRFNVFGERPLKLSKPEKISLIVAAWFRHLLGRTGSCYGQP